MKRLILIISLSVVPYLLLSQVSLVMEGTTINNTVTGNWAGVNIPRAEKTSLIYRNNSVTSVNASGYLLQAGDEVPMTTNNNLDGAFITGNKLTWNGTDASSNTHGMFMGYNINFTVRYNYLDKTPYGILFKSGSDAGTNMTYSPGYGASYNIVRNSKMSVRMKGINGVQVYNNTFYSSLQSGTLIYIDANNDRPVPAASTGAKIKNNIFYTVHQIPSITIESRCLSGFESDYNIFYCESGTPVFSVDGSRKTFAQWQAMGYDQHSVVINPNFKSTTTFVPSARLDRGVDLGSAWSTGLSTNAVWSAGKAPETTSQNGLWQVGAIIYAAAPVVTPPPAEPPPAEPPPPAVTPPPVTPAPAPVNNPPVIVVNYSSENLSGFVGEIDATASYDANKDKLSYSWVTPANLSVSSSTGSLIRYLSPVVNETQTVEFILKVSDGKTTQSKTIPVKIYPYKPELKSAEVINIEASGFQTPNYPYNIIDGNIGTMWSANGDEQWVVMELREPFSIQHIRIAFKPGQKAEAYFDILGSNDKENWEPVLIKTASCGFSGDLHVFDFPETKSQIGYRFVKLVGHSNSSDSWNHISEFRVFGYRHISNAGYEELPVKLYPNPARETVKVRIDDQSFNPGFIRIISLTGKVVYEAKMDPGLKDLQIPVTFREGIYIVQFGSGDLTLFSQKLVVNG